jgi:hypothetical protein
VPADFTSARSLVSRAQDQFDALKAKADAFLEQNEWGIETMPDKDGWVLRVNIPQQPPEDWWMDLGEMADNARAALNHLAFHLVIRNGGDPNKGRVQFPIFEVQQDYLGNGGMKSNREKMLAGISKGDRKLIDDAQPYTLGDDAPDHPLSILRSLTDRHKHRQQHVGVAFLKAFQVTEQYTGGSPQIRGGAVTIGRFDNPDPLLDHQVIHAAYPGQEPNEDFTDFMWSEEAEQILKERLPGLPKLVRGELTGIEANVPPTFTIGFFGDRPFKIDAIGEGPPYVRGLIERFERRIKGKRARARPSR